MRSKFYAIAMMLCAALILSAAPAIAAPAKDDISIRASIDKKSVLIGDRIRYKVEISSRKELEIQPLKFKDGKIGDLEIKDSGRKAEKGFFGRRTYTRWYDIAAYATGKHLIPPIEFQCRPKGAGDWLAKRTPELTISVGSVLPKNTKIEDIKEIKGPLKFYEFPWFWIALAFTLAVLFISGRALYLHLRRRLEIKPPYDAALAELAAIREDLSKTGQVKEYYFRVSACVRAYIEAVFHLKAPEMTTEEFLPSLGTSGALSDSQKRLLRDFLEACDLVKFARHVPKTEEVESVLGAARNFIEETKPASQAKKGV
jgi:hypothetical protein